MAINNNNVSSVEHNSRFLPDNIQYCSVDTMLLKLGMIPCTGLEFLSLDYSQCSHLNLLSILTPRVDAQNDEGLYGIRFFKVQYYSSSWWKTE